MGGESSAAEERAQDALERVPSGVRAVIDAAARHHTFMLAAGLAFLGLVSVAPALGVGLGLLRLVASEQTVNALVAALQGSMGGALGLADLLGQMQDQAGRYAGLGMLVLLWPATTMASGWRRALEAVHDQESTPALRGLAGRGKGLLVGLFLLSGILVLLAALVAAMTVDAGRTVVLGGIVVAGLTLQYLFALLVYRYLPATSPSWSGLWPGAAASTVGVGLVTVGLGVGLGLVDSLSQQYPPTLSTAMVIGLWLYGANLSLLLGAELNAARRTRR